MRGSVTVPMRAAPEIVWAVVSDITRIGELSPETFEAEWADGATGPVLGAHFRGHVKRNGIGPTYWSSCKVTACELGKEFGFAVYAGGVRANNWHYRLVARDGGTEVTESFELGTHPVLRVYAFFFGRARRRTNERGMRQTLERIRTMVEREPTGTT